MAKHFVFGGKRELSREDREQIRVRQEQNLRIGDILYDELAAKKIAEEDTLIHVEGRIVVKVDTLFKNSHRFEDGSKIRIERGFNNFNRRQSQPVNCIVISGEGMPPWSEVLVSHNALHETNRINNYKQHFENEESDRVRYYSIPDYECFVWRPPGGDWRPIQPFEFALRVFEPYRGSLEGIDPKLLTDTLYVTTGELAGQVVKTGKGCDYQIVFQGDDGTEKNLIRFRPFGDPKTKREEEALAILHDLTDLVNKGELLVGLTISDAAPKSFDVAKEMESQINKATLPFIK